MQQEMIFSEMPPATAGVAAAKRRRGQRAYLSGLAAERAVAAAYDTRGADLLEARWRGKAGEIDLIFKHEGIYIFCEVKAARSFDAALERLRPAQMQRIHLAASEYVGRVPEGQLADMRFDLAVVNGEGAVQICAGAFSHF